MASEDGFIFVSTMQQMHEKPEIKHLLITTAINIRIGRDYQRVHYPENPDQTKAGVGKLVEDGKNKPLTLIEACNKIIHATRFAFEEEKTAAVKNSKGDELKLPYLTPVVHLDGTRWNKSKKKDVPWKAILDLEAFARTAAVASVGFMWQFREVK